MAGHTLHPIEVVVEKQKRFITDASHELRTPLTSLRVSMEVALKEKRMSVPQARKIIKENLEEVISLQTLSNRLLSLVILETGRFHFPKVRIDLPEAVKLAY